MMRIRQGIVWGIALCSAWALAGQMAAAQVNAGRKIARDLKDKASGPKDGEQPGDQPSGKKTKPESTKAAPAEGFSVGPSQTVKFAIDGKSARNQVSFTSKAPKETIVGKTSKATGKLSFNPRKIDAIEGLFAVAWKDIDTGNPMRNKHLQGSPWVDSEKNPEIVFTVSEIKNVKTKGAGGKALSVELVGKMAMNGKEKEMKIPATLAYIEPKKAGGHDALGIKATFKIALADYGIVGNGGVGSKVSPVETCSVSLSLTGPEGSSDASAEAKPKKKTTKS